MLLDKSQAVIDDINALETMPKSERVAVKRILTPHLRANIFWPDDVKKEAQADPVMKGQCPGMINTPLPVFIVMSEHGELPEIGLPRAMNEKQVVRKADSKLKPIRDSKHCRVYGYLS